MEPGLQEGSIEEQSDNSFCVRFPCGALTLHSHCRRNIRIKIGNLQSMDVEPPPIRSSGNRWFPRLPPIFFWPKHHWFSPRVSRMPIVWDQFPSVHCKTQSLAQMGDTISTLHCCLPFYDERMVAKLSPKHSFCNFNPRPKNSSIDRWHVSLKIELAQLFALTFHLNSYHHSITFYKY